MSKETGKAINEGINVFGERLRELRARKVSAMTQEKLAETLGISPQAVSRWENGAAMPDIQYIPKLACLFNVSSDYLLGVDMSERDEKVREIRTKAANWDDEADSFSTREERYAQWAGQIAILRNGLAQFPGNLWLIFDLIGELMNYAAQLRHEFPEREKEAKALMKEALSLADYAEANCGELDTYQFGHNTGKMKYALMDYRVSLCRELGDERMIKLSAERLPSAYLCKEVELIEKCGDSETVLDKMKSQSSILAIYMRSRDCKKARYIIKLVENM